MTDKIIPDSDASSEISDISEMERSEPDQHVQTGGKRTAEPALQPPPADSQDPTITKDSKDVTETPQSAAAPSSKAAADTAAEVPEAAEPRSKEEMYAEAKARRIVSRHLHGVHGIRST
jgi:hypothetical protein